ncbi:MAG: aspartate carbamoyltransferase regulatory subunit [Candidatus Hydrothermarchaeales archaeon]
MVKDIRVRKIKSGTVIDHIAPGQAMNVLKIIGITEEYPKTTLTVAMNVPSRKAGTKDIVKVEGRELRAEEVDKISLIAPNAIINIIRDYDVVEKKEVSIPDRVEGVLRCANPNCITNSEGIKSKFIVERKEPIKIRCTYCERIMEEEDLVRQF